MPRPDRRAWTAAALLALAGCGGVDGFARVQASFLVDECKPGTARELDDYGFEAGYVFTERFSGVLLIALQDHQVNVEESDGLVMRVDLQGLIDAGQVVLDAGGDHYVRPEPPGPRQDPADIVLETAPDGTPAQAALSLFVTCPEYPTHHALSGQLRLNQLTLARDPQDTGVSESIGGTLTATLTRANQRTPVGRVVAEFSFFPPRRPLTDFK